MKIFWWVVGILVGLWAVCEVAGRVLWNLWMQHEIQILSERMRDETGN